MKKLFALFCASGVLLAAEPMAQAQQGHDVVRCDETLRSLDQELRVLTERLTKKQGEGSEANEKQFGLPETGLVLAQLVNMKAMRNHLTCLGTRVRDPG